MVTSWLFGAHGRNSHFSREGRNEEYMNYEYLLSSSSLNDVVN
jgi:hypothetical protein